MRKFVNDMAYLGNSISDNLARTPEGFLICRDVPISRIGEQFYSGEELKEEKGKTYKLYRLPEDVFNTTSLASIEGKPATDDHPWNEKDTKVTPQNYKRISKGHIQNIRPDEANGVVLADFIINDANLAGEVEKGEKREVSLGYVFDMLPHMDGFKQVNIIVNHAAIVKKGRAGPMVRINDSVSKKRNYNSMKHIQAATLLAFARNEDTTPEAFATAMKGLDSASVEVADDSKTMLQAIQSGFAQMTAALTKKPKKGLDAEDEPEKKAEDSDEEDEKDKRLKAAEDSIKELKAALDAKKGKDSDDDLEKMLDDDEPKKGEDSDEEDEDKSKKAADAAMRSVIIALKPILATMPEKHRKAAKDSLRPLLTGIASSDKEYSKVSEAVKASKDAADAANKPEPIDYKAIAAEIAKERDAK